DSVSQGGGHPRLVHVVRAGMGYVNDSERESGHACLSREDVAANGVHRDSVHRFIHRRQQPSDGIRMLLVEDVQRPCTVFAGAPRKQDLHLNASGWSARANASVAMASLGPGTTR